MTPNELKGRINDVDSHEQIMLSHWGETFGEIGAEVCARVLHWFNKILKDAEKAGEYFEVEVEKTPIDEETLRTVRGSAAPGAMSFDRRLQVLDLEGIQRQLVFPFFGLWAPVFDATPVARAAERFGLDNATPQTLEELSRGVQKAYNRWAAEQTNAYAGRIRPAGILRSKSTLDQLLRDTEEILASGLRSLMVPAALPPAGKSPADEALDPFWSMCAAADAPVLIHIGDESAYRSSEVWGDLPVFARQPTETNEVPLDPFTLSTAHHPAENFLTAMVLSGVFERHPTLRFGLIEFGAEWIGPLSARLDLWAAQFSRRMAKILSMKPSEYISRNVRVSTFHFEPVHEYVEMYGLEDVYCYATDYPHNEGGKDPLGSHLSRFEGVSENFQEKFFVKNGELLLPQ